MHGSVLDMGVREAKQGTDGQSKKQNRLWTETAAEAYLHSMKITSSRTATLGHQTQQPRLQVSDRNPDARHIGRVCTTPIT